MDKMRNVAILVGSLTGGGAEKAACLLSIELSRKWNVYFFVINMDVITYRYNGLLIKVGENGLYEDVKLCKIKLSLRNKT